MNKTRSSRRFLPLILCIVLLLCAMPVHAEAQSGPFRYLHDPRLNSRAMEDIVVNPDAVYGFSPSPDGGLAAYTSWDYTDSGAVLEHQQERLEYFDSLSQLYDLLNEMTEAGKSTEEIARAVSTRRNELRMAANEDPDELATLKQRNLERYGHEEGPLPDELYEKYGSWDDVIEKAFNHNSGADACLGLYDAYYDYYLAFGYVQDEQTAIATREYAVACLAEAAGLSSGSAALDTFGDAQEVSPWFADSLGKALSAGVVRGYEDKTLRPQDTISRLEAMVILSRCLPELEAIQEPVSFSDVPAWAKKDIDRLSAAALIFGNSDGTLGANEPLTVEQVRLLAARAQGGSLLGALEAASSRAYLFTRHETAKGELVFYYNDEAVSRISRNLSAGSAYTVFDNGFASYHSPDLNLQTMNDDFSKLYEELCDDDGYWDSLLYAQTLFAFPESEKLVSVREENGELLVTTKEEDAELLAAYLQDGEEEPGRSYRYETGTSMRFVYRFDAKNLDLREVTATLCLPDGQEALFETITYAYDVVIDEPDDSDSPLAAYFDETRQQIPLTMICDPGTPEEETLYYSLPAGTFFSFWYKEDYHNEFYEDAACTQPFEGRNDRPELTLYVRTAA